MHAQVPIKGKSDNKKILLLRPFSMKSPKNFSIKHFLLSLNATIWRLGYTAGFHAKCPQKPKHHLTLTL